MPLQNQISIFCSISTSESGRRIGITNHDIQPDSNLATRNMAAEGDGESDEESDDAGGKEVEDEVEPALEGEDEVLGTLGDVYCVYILVDNGARPGEGADGFETFDLFF